MRRVLVIAYAFPPIGGAGPKPTVNLLKYLPTFGWEPVVLTTTRSVYSPRDLSLMDETKRYPVYRAYSFEHRALRFIPYKLGHWSNLLTPPDEYVGWLPFAYAMAKQIVKEGRIDAIFSTTPSYSSHLIPVWLKKKYGLPWIEDFRDLWTLNPFISYPSKLHALIDRKMERYCVENADVVSVVSPRRTEAMRRKYPDLPPDRFRVLLNGYDPDEIASIRLPKERRVREVVYMGSLYGGRSPKPLIDALDIVRKKDPAAYRRLRFTFVGNVEDRFKAMLDRHENIQSLSYIPHKATKEMYGNADALLLVIRQGPRSEGLTPGKIVEYICLQRPILAIIPKGDAWDILEELGLDQFCYTHDDVEGLADGIVRLSNTRVPLDRPAGLEKYSSKEQARKLAGWLDEIAK